MESIVFWQQGSNDINTEAILNEIAQWWAQLQDKEIIWQQRPLAVDQDRSVINWEPHKFDEVFQIVSPQLRGITLYWQKPTVTGERNLTASYLRLDRLAQTLEILPDSARNYIVRVTVKEPTYKMLILDDPIVELINTPTGKSLLFKDQQALLAIEVHLSDSNLARLSQLLVGS